MISTRQLLQTSESPIKQDYVTILAIYDDPPPIPAHKTQHRSREVQITNDELSTLHVPIPLSRREEASKALNESGKKNVSNSGLIGEKNWQRTDVRKSRISDAFLDAKERIEQEQLERNNWLSSFDPKKYRFQRIILSSETQDIHMGIEISAVPNPERPSHLLAVEVRTIEKNGRLAEDGRLRVGDQIVAINGTSCEQISFARARLHLRELQSMPEPSLSFFRRTNAASNETSIKLQRNENRNAVNVNVLQKGNTSQIGECKEISIIKGQDGFGFNYAGRINANEEHLYYVKGLRKDQDLAVGDRILKIDGFDLAGLDQNQITAMLKSKPIGAAVTLLISRSEGEEEQAKKQSEAVDGEQIDRNNSKPDDQVLERELISMIGDKQQLLQLNIPLNATPGAGLGISIKAQRLGSNDRGLYVRSILHGSAAYKDARLCINDRLVAIEAENLLKYTLNGEALNAFMRTLAQLPPDKSTVRIFVAREKNAPEKLGNRWGSDSELSQSEGFIRDSSTRRSISEKRPMGLHNDPAHLRTYQRIVHQRQTSAPALSSAARSRRSLHEPAMITTGPTPEQAIRRSKHRPKTIFYVDNNKELTTHSRTLPSPKCPPPNNIDTQCPINSIQNSTSHPESLAGLTRSGTIPSQIECNSKPNNKRRNSMGSGLLIRFFGKQKSKNERSPQHSHPSPNYMRPPPPPYGAVHPQHYYSPEQPCTSLLLPPPAPTNFVYCPNSFRHPSTKSPPGPGSVEVPHWQRGAVESPNSHYRPLPLRITTSHSTYGSPPIQLHPSASEPIHWQFPPNGTSHQQSNKILGRAKPSAIFYDDHPEGSHWILRC